MKLIIIIFCFTSLMIQAQTQQKREGQNYPQKINAESEPILTELGGVSLFDGKTFDGWNVKQGTMKFEVKNGEIVGNCGPGRSTFLCTNKDYKDFIFSCEMQWEEDGNSGVQIRSNTRQDKNGLTVFGPQAELEDYKKKDRGWTGGIYGQACGGWFYPMKHPQHQAVKESVDRIGWNRLTIKVKGNVFQTWVNGIPAAYWIDEENKFPTGFIGLQVHGGKQGITHWRNIMIKEL